MDEDAELFYAIQDVLDDGLEFISKYEKLSRNEGQIKVIYGQEMGIEIYAPHLIPNALSYTWAAETLEEAFTSCLKDLENWVEIEKSAPRDKFSLDI